MHMQCEATSADDNDDLDLFDDEFEEEKKAGEEREAAKRTSRKKESGKSSVLLDFKPWDDETNMKKLEEVVCSIEMPGLLGGVCMFIFHHLIVSYIYDVICLTIIDNLISVVSLIEEHLTSEPCNKYDQSYDIVAFNKI